LVFVYSYAMIQMQKKSNLEVLHSKASTLANSIALVCNDAMVKDDMSFIVEHNIDVLKKNKEVLKILVTNTSNNNIEVFRSGWRVVERIPSYIRDMEKKDEFFKIIYSPQYKESVFYYTYPVKLPGIDWGYIHIIYSLKSYNEAIATLYKSIALLLGLLFLGTLFVSYILSRQIILPIIQLTQSAESVARGDLHTRVDIQRDDEIGALAENFNSMIDRLEHSHEELENLVQQRTKELEDLNKKLDIKIQKAIEENSQKEQMLIQQSRLAAMGEMIGNIAHQWRQPLNALGLIVQNINFSYQMGDLDKEYLERASKKSQKLTQQMSKTIDDFRNFFRPDKIKESFLISERIESVAELISASYKNHNIILHKELDDSLQSYGYPNEFSQVLLNIFTNAKDAFLEKKIKNPQVWIRSFDEGEKIVVEIEDNAGGIDEAIMDKIFDPYFSTKDKNVGTGIGLYMSKMIIENSMGGFISAYNANEGAVFRIEIDKGQEDAK